MKCKNLKTFRSLFSFFLQKPYWFSRRFWKTAMSLLGLYSCYLDERTEGRACDIGRIAGNLLFATNWRLPQTSQTPIIFCSHKLRDPDFREYSSAKTSILRRFFIWCPSRFQIILRCMHYTRQRYVMAVCRYLTWMISKLYFFWIMYLGNVLFIVWIIECHLSTSREGAESQNWKCVTFLPKMTSSTCTVPGNTEYVNISVKPIASHMSHVSNTRNIHSARLQTSGWFENLTESWICPALWSWVAFWLPPLMEHTAIWQDHIPHEHKRRRDAV